ncbi:MAG: glycosyltransferase family A protein [Cyanobacteria bacterium J06632_3]
MTSVTSAEAMASASSLPSITAVIPAYNAAAYLPATIQSVIDQSWSDWELLVIDDGSTDETPDIVRRFSAKDSRVRLIRKENGGVSSARNLGAQKARSSLVAFLDADDRWLADKLECHVAYMRSHPHVGVSFARVEFITAEGQSTQKLTNNIVSQLSPHDFFYTNPTVTTSNMVIRKGLFEAMGGFDRSMQYNEDVDLLLRIALLQKERLQKELLTKESEGQRCELLTSEAQGEKQIVSDLPLTIAAIDQVLVQYRLHESGLSSTLLKMEEGWIKLMDKASKQVPKLVEMHYGPAYGAQLQYLARQTLRLNLPASMGIGFINRALKRNWKALHKNPKMLALALLIYFRWMTFGTVRVSV